MQVEVNSLYRHFKGGIVKVVGIAKDSEDEKRKVVYYHLNDENNWWVRDYDMFISLVDKKKYPKVLQKYRFEKIDN